MKLLEGRTIKNNTIKKPSMEAGKTSKEEITEVREEHQEVHDQECVNVEKRGDEGIVFQKIVNIVVKSFC